MKIAGFEVGPGNPVFIVAEGGSNHGGSLEAALALTDAAADAGANAMKWQLWNPEKMYDPNQFPEEYISAVKWQLPRVWLPMLHDRAQFNGLAFGCSAFDFDSLDFVDQFVDFHKVASIESTWGPFVAAVVDKRRPTLISHGLTGPGNALRNDYWWWSEVEHIISLHCVVSYPAEIADTNLRSHPPLDRWGLSDHTTHPTIAPCAAVALGACVIEKHIRLCVADEDCAVPKSLSEAPDAAHSLCWHEFVQMAQAIRLTEKALGSGEKRIRLSEEPYLKYRRGPRGLRGS